MSPSTNAWRRYRDPLLILLLLLLPLIFYVSNSRSEREQTVLDRGVLAASAPVQWLVVAGIDSVGQLAQRYLALVGVQADNERLQTENAGLRRELAAVQEQRLDNERLRLLVGLRERAPSLNMLFAEVIGTGTSPLFRALRIDRGSNDGIVLGDAVVNHDGVVGRIANLGGSHADVMLLVDASNSVDVLVQRTRARARARGQGGDDRLGLDLQYLSRTADIEPGDFLVTSGLGHNFPKGLRVARVNTVEQPTFGLYQRAVAQPSVDFGRLEAVMVILGGYAEDTSLEPVETTDMHDLPPPQELPTLLPAPALPAPKPGPPSEAGTDLPRATDQLED